jgi:adenylate kinase family enzyme
MPDSQQPRRILVLGSTGAGKTMLALRVSAALGVPHVELDALHWGPHWTKRDTFEAEAAAWIARDAWVIDGGYGDITRAAWPRAELVVWLDLPFVRVFFNQFRRSFRRIVGREEIFGGNRETFRGYFLSRNSLLLWLVRTHRAKGRFYSQLAGQHPEVALLRLRSHRAADAWLATLESR